jgi:hypothetical protein
VVERAVLEHEHDDVLDLVERVDRVVELDLDEAGGRLRRSSEMRAEEARQARKECADASHDLDWTG